MAVPSVTCGADILKNYSAGTQLVNLSATATQSPTGYTWTLLDVPTGSTAMTETRGSFVNGVATVQNPSFETDAALEGAYVFQCVATNATGDSEPDVGKASAQQVVIVKTQVYELTLNGDYQWAWGDYNTNNLLTLEDKVSTNETDIATNAASIAGLSGSSHSHSNKTQLDLVTDGDHDVATGNPHSTKLDELATPDDNTNLNATTSYHGLLRKLSNVSTEFLNGEGNWATPAGGGGGSSPLTTKGDVYTFSGVDARLPVGSDGEVLTVDSAEATGLKWASAGTTSPLTTTGDLYTFSGVNTRLPVGANGQLLSADPSEATGLKWVNPVEASTAGQAIVALDQAIVGGPHTMPDTTFAGIPSMTGVNFTVPAPGNYDLYFEGSYYTTGSSGTGRAWWQVVIDKGEVSEQTIGGLDAHWFQAINDQQRYRFSATGEVEALASGVHTVDIEWARHAPSGSYAFGCSTDDAYRVKLIRRAPALAADGFGHSQSQIDSSLTGNTQSGSLKIFDKNFTVPYDGQYRLQLNAVAWHIWSTGDADSFFTVIIDEGLTGEQTLGGTTWRVDHNTAAAYQLTPTFSDAVVLGAGAHSVRVYAESTPTSNSYLLFGGSASPTQVELQLIGNLTIPTVTTDTLSPQGTYASGTTTDFDPRPGQPATTRLTLQDGVQRTMTTGTVDIANGVADWGYDHSDSTGNDKWIYFYAVPSSSDDDVLVIVMSDNDPNTGPDGYSNWKYVWSNILTAGGTFAHVVQEGNRFICQQRTLFSEAPTGGTDEGTPGVEMDLSGHVPVTAGAVNFFYYLNSSASSHWRVQFRDNGSEEDLWGGEIQTLNGGTESGAFEIPLLGSPKGVYRRVFRNSGSDSNANWHVLWVTGWIDSWIDAGASRYSSEPVRVVPSLWGKPETPHVEDVEFEGSFPGSWSETYTVSGSSIDPYASFAAGDVRRDIQDSWLRVQPPGDSTVYFAHKAITIPANCFVWARFRTGHREAGISNNDASMGIGLYETDTGVPDRNNMVEIWCPETNANEYSSIAIYQVGGGGFNNLGRTADQDDGRGLLMDYAGIQRISNTYHFWLFSDSGQFFYMGNITGHTITPDRIAIGFVLTATTSPGNLIMGCDFVRMVEGATFLPSGGRM